jgi:hypothetical protein
MLNNIAAVSMGLIKPISDVTVLVSYFIIFTTITIAAIAAVIMEKTGPITGNLVFATHCVSSEFGLLPSISHFLLHTPASKSHPLAHS